MNLSTKWQGLIHSVLLAGQLFLSQAELPAKVSKNIMAGLAAVQFVTGIGLQNKKSEDSAK